MKLFQDTDFDGIEGYVIFLDIDGTLSNDDEAVLSEKTVAKVAQMKRKNEVHLCSNSRNHDRNRKVGELAGVDYLDTDLRKPSRKLLGLVEHHAEAKRLVIGDKFLTDGIFARRIKARFIKVKRIESERDRFYIKFLYWIDDLVSKII